LRVGWPGWLAGWLGDAASLVLPPWPTQNPPQKGGKKKRKEVHLLIIKEKWNSSKILYSLLFYILASTYNFVELFIYFWLPT
jgi:hypothetical protein